MSDELTKWECPNCGNEDEDFDLHKTHCSGCGLVVFVSDGGAVSQEWFIYPRPTPRALDLPCTCPKSPLGFVMVKAHDCPEHGTASQ